MSTTFSRAFSRNQALINSMTADFQGRYEPQFSLANVFSTFYMLPQLRGFWPMSAHTTAAQPVVDISANGLNLQLTNAPTYAIETEKMFPRYALNGTNQHLNRPGDDAALDMTGQFTIGGWFYFNNITNVQSLIAKWDLGNWNYIMFVESGTIRMAVAASSTSDSVTVYNSGLAPVLNAWNFCAMRFTPSTSLSIFVNGNSATTAYGSATLFNSTTRFCIGARNLGTGATSFLNGRVSICFVTAFAQSNSIVENLFDTSRALYGV